jgi:hypothetical protein
MLSSPVAGGSCNMGQVLRAFIQSAGTVPASGQRGLARTFTPDLFQTVL